MLSYKQLSAIILFILSIAFIFPATLQAQIIETPLSLLESYTGRYDYTVTGGTLRTASNATNACSVTNAGSAAISGIPAGATVVKAYLYWAGSGSTPDYNVTFQGQSITDDRNYTGYYEGGGISGDFFNGIADVTSIVTSEGNTTYTFSDLSVDSGGNYCSYSIVLAGWSLIVVYEEPTLPIKKVNLYEGFDFDRYSATTFTLDGLLVPADATGSVTGLFWEGDENYQGTSEYPEELAFNGNSLTDTYNPADGAYNSTINSLGVSNSWGVDLDTFDVSNFLSEGDTSATVVTRSGQDLIIKNLVIIAADTYAPEFTISKTSDATGPVEPGDTVTYTIEVENTGTGSATDVTISDDLPDGLSYVDGSAQKTYPASGGAQSLSIEDTSSVPPFDNNCPTEEEVTINVPDSFIINDLNVGFNLDHTWKGDMNLWVTSPTGTRVQLITDRNDPSNNWDVLFDSDSSNSYTTLFGTHNTNTPYYDVIGQPLNTLDVFDGENAQGDWIISFCDEYGQDTAYYNRSLLEFSYTGSGGTVTDAANPPPGLVTSPDNIGLLPGETLTVTYQVTVDENTVGMQTNTATVDSAESDPQSDDETIYVFGSLDSWESTYTAEVNSYHRDPHGSGRGTDTIYTGAPGYPPSTGFEVAYYDADGNLVYTDTGASSDATGFLTSSYANDSDTVAYGTWTAVVIPDGTTPLSTLNDQLADPSTLAADTFDVNTWSTTQFTDVNGIPVTDYDLSSGSSTAYIQVADQDQNSDPNVAETITVIVTSLSGDSEVVTLTETGPDTGIFTSSLPLSTSSGGSINDGTLFVLEGGAGLVVNYVDGDDSTDTSSDDANTPTLAVIESFGAYTAGGQVMVEWQTASENRTIGFHLERFNEKRSKYQRVNRKLLPGLLVAPQGGTYRYPDKKAQPGGTYTYQLVEKEVGSKKRVYGPFTVTVDDPEFKSQYALDENSDTINVDGASLERKAKKRKKRLKKAVRKMKKDRRAIRKSGRLGMNISLEANGLYYISIEDIAHSLNISLTKAKRWIKSRRFALTHQGLSVAWQPAPNGEGLYFCGEMIDSHYTNVNVYQLTRGKGKMITAIQGEGPEVLNMLDGFTAETHAELDQWALTALFDDPNDDFWAWDFLFAGHAESEQKRFTIVIPGLITGTAGDLTVYFKGGEDTDHRVLVSVNETAVGDFQFSGTISHSATLDIPAGILTEGENTVTLTAQEPPVETETSVVYIDSFDLSYEKAFTAIEDQLHFKAEGRDVITVDGFSSDNIQVFDVTDPLNTIQTKAITIEDAGNGTYSVSLWVDNPDGRFLALADPATKVPGAEALTSFNTQYLKQTSHSVDYLVITPEELKDGAQDLADYRQGRGYDTMVVLLPDIYDAFNFGIANPEAIRDFLEYVWHNWRKAPRYVVRVGDGSHDYKDIQGTGDTLMPPYMVTTPYGLSASENRLADVDGSDDGLPEMVMGLLPAKTEDDLTDMIDKIIAFEESGGDWKNNILMVADNPDDGGDFQLDSDAVAMLVPAGYQVDSIYLGDHGIAETRQILSTRLNEGTFLMNYFGHGSINGLADEGIWTMADLDSMSNQDRLPIFLGMTCVAGRFEIPGFDAIGEAMVVKPDGGAVAAWVPTGFSMNDQARHLDEAFFKAVFADNQSVLGEAALAAMASFKNLHSDTNNVYMLDIYTLIGDPALMLK